MSDQNQLNIGKLFDWRSELRATLQGVLKGPITKYLRIFAADLERLEEVDSDDADNAEPKLDNSFLILAVPGPDYIDDPQLPDADTRRKSAMVRVQWAGMYIWPSGGSGARANILSCNVISAAIIANIGWYTLQFLALNARIECSGCICLLLVDAARLLRRLAW